MRLNLRTMSDFQNTPEAQQPQQDANAANYAQQGDSYTNSYAQQDNNSYTQQNNPYAQQAGDPYAQQQGNPYSQPQYSAYPQQGYYYPQPAYQRWNMLCIVGFILSFLVAPAGLICSIIAVIQINRSGEKSKGLAIAGIIVSVFNMLIGLLLVVLFAIGVSAMTNPHDISQYLNNDYSQLSDPDDIDRLLQEYDLT